MVYARAPVDLLDGLPTTSLPVFSTDGPAAASPKRDSSPPPPSKTLVGANQVPSDSDNDQSEEEREKRLKDLQDQVGSNIAMNLFSCARLAIVLDI